MNIKEGSCRVLQVMIKIVHDLVSYGNKMELRCQDVLGKGTVYCQRDLLHWRYFVSWTLEDSESNLMDWLEL